MMSGDAPSSVFFRTISANKYFSGGCKYIIIEENAANLNFAGKNSFIGVRVNSGKITVSGESITVMVYQNKGEITAKGKNNLAKVIDTNFQGRVVVTDQEPARFFARRPEASLQPAVPRLRVRRNRDQTPAPNDQMNGSANQSIIEARFVLTRNENIRNRAQLGTSESHGSGLRMPHLRRFQPPNPGSSATRVLLQPLPQINPQLPQVTQPSQVQQSAVDLRPEGKTR